MGFMNDCKVTFNGVDLTSYGLTNVTVGNNIKPHIFGANKSIQTAKSLYGKRNVITGCNKEPITFDLTFSRGNTMITENFCSELYQIFDVTTYKALKFGNEDIYYNAMPMVGSVSELNLYIGSKGYITIPFVCDAGNGWIDKEYNFNRSSSNIGVTWSMNNPCNVKDINNTYRVYPYIEIQVPMNTNYVSFGLASLIDEGDDNAWFTLDDISGNQTIIIDCENKQCFSSAGDNIVDKIRYDQFFFLEGGDNTIYHRQIQGTTSYYNIDFYLSCPYMT